MKKTLLICAALCGTAVLGACSASSPVGQAVAAAVPLTTADLNDAMAMATGAGDTEGATCFGWMAAQLPAIQAVVTPPAAPTVSGAFSAFEAAHLGVNAVQNGIPTALRTGFEVNCGPYVANVIGGINGLLMQVAASGIKL